MDKSHLQSVAMSGLFKYIDADFHQQVWDELCMAPHNYVSDETIYHQDEIITRAAIVHKGIVKGERLHAEGSSHLAYVYRRGEIFAFEGALSGKRTSPLQLSAQGDTTAIFFDIQKVFNSSFERELLSGLMELLANDDIKKLYRIEILSRRSIRGRIMAHFKFLASRYASNTFSLDMNREQLAQYLCVNRSALSNELNVMKREGIIDFNKNTFTLLSEDAHPVILNTEGMHSFDGFLQKK
ncbi:MAG: Crp/Fnr family transcriptional regulator [Bacillota bacterium]|nr:Crp/Fnr family transcriptional regulator [Bacillota bacterium]